MKNYWCFIYHVRYLVRNSCFITLTPGQLYLAFDVIFITMLFIINYLQCPGMDLGQWTISFNLVSIFNGESWIIYMYDQI